MHDEAASHFVDMIDQTSVGHRFLAETFNATPRVGWQLDPFGHSATQASLLGAESGFDALYFGRIDYQDLAVRIASRAIEFVWRGSPSLGAQSQVLAGLTGGAKGNYGPPDGFCWDVHCDDAPMQSDRRLDGYNKEALVERFVGAARDLAKATRGRHVLFTMGSDFNYESAHSWFTPLDELIDAVNADGRVVVTYATMSEYVDAKRAEQQDEPTLRYPLKTDDFFPYADGPHQFWTGYFTSRPAFKRAVRSASAAHQALRQLGALSGVAGLRELAPLEEALALAQHHDAISGTAKQHVAFDYDKRLSLGLSRAKDAALKGLAVLSGAAKGQEESLRLLIAEKKKTGSDPAIDWCLRANESVCPPTQNLNVGAQITVYAWNAAGSVRQALLELPVPSGCEEHPNAPAAVPTAHRKQYGTFSLRAAANSDDEIPFEILPALPVVSSYERANVAAARCVATALVSLPPIGFSSFILSREEGGSILAREQGLSPLSRSQGGRSEGGTAAAEAAAATAAAAETDALTPSVEGPEAAQAAPPRGMVRSLVEIAAGGPPSVTPTSVTPPTPPEDNLVLKGSDLQLTFSARGELLAMENTRAGVSSELKLSYGYYESSEGDAGCAARDLWECSTQPGGAYIFRPQGDAASLRASGAPTLLSVHRGPIVQEVRTAFGEWITQRVRLVEGERHAEVTFTVGPVPLERERGEGGHLPPRGQPPPPVGKDVVLRISSHLASGGEWFTDSNGREMLKRTRDARPSWAFNQSEPVAGNYYPVNGAVAIRDGTRQLTVLSDSSLGGGSLHDGELELMLHRRLLVDDFRGVGEPLNETESVHPYVDCGGRGQRGCGEHYGNGLIVRGTLLLTLERPETAAAVWRPLMEFLYHKPLLAFGAAHAELHTQGSRLAVYSALRSALPSNVALVTLVRTSARTILLRLGHLFGEGEDASLSRPATIDLAAIFSREVLPKIEGAVELTLSANQPKHRWIRRRAAWRVEGEDAPPRVEPWHVPLEWANSTYVLLGPLQIKTFALTLADEYVW